MKTKRLIEERLDYIEKTLADFATQAMKNIDTQQEGFDECYKRDIDIKDIVDNLRSRVEVTETIVINLYNALGITAEKSDNKNDGGDNE